MKYETIARFDDIDALRKQAERVESELSRVTADRDAALENALVIARNKNAEIERLEEENARLRGELEALQVKFEVTQADRDHWYEVAMKRGEKLQACGFEDEGV